MKDNHRLTFSRTSVYNVNYHLIWSTKYRNKVLKDNVEPVLKDELDQISVKYGFQIEHLKIELQDHVHLLISAPPKYSITSLVSWLKGISARKMFIKCPELQTSDWKQTGRHLWSSSYYVETIGTPSQPAIAKYIDDQQKK